MQRGFNTDIRVKGVGYHIQTEDWGVENPYIVTRVFKNGAVIRSIKRCYQKALGLSPNSLHEAVQFALNEQHEKILDLLQTGQLK
jgi:hypothetical protein